MSEFDTANTLYLLLLLMLVGASLVGMRLSAAKVVKMALAWVAIFAFAFAIFAFRGEFGALGQRLRAEALGTPVASGEMLRIPRAEDGHYWVEASVNGVPARFLIDSGASITTISRSTAAAAGVRPGYRVPVETANGTVDMARASAGRFAVGSIERTDMTVFVSGQDNVNVIGMNFLSSLERWSVEGQWLILVP